jgi:putative membrane protein
MQMKSFAASSRGFRQPPAWSSRLRSQWIMIAPIYVLLVAGGFWHALGVLQAEMRLLASPMIIVISLVLCYDFIAGEISQAMLAERRRLRFFAWCVFVILSSFLVEMAGVKTGLIFGRYEYLDALQPSIWGVPIAIGFAWLGMIVSAIALAQRITFGKAGSRAGIAALAAAFMMVFDFFMEPAAMKLGYWQWFENTIPAHNYFGWFVFGAVFSYIGLRLGLFEKKISSLAVHAYVGQLLYFLIVDLSR